jgi:hypothetical protein
LGGGSGKPFFERLEKYPTETPRSKPNNGNNANVPTATGNGASRPKKEVFLMIVS